MRVPLSAQAPLGKPLSIVPGGRGTLGPGLARWAGMSFTEKHLAREFLTISKMTVIYCRDHHDTAGGELCEKCSGFLGYAETRLHKCPYGDDKPTCTNCPVHCYKPEQRAYAKEIMRYAGPKMILRHPWLAIAHIVDGYRKARHPRELSREERLRSRHD